VFIYIQSFFLILLETLCCKIFFETFGIVRNTHEKMRNNVCLTCWVISVYLAAMMLEDAFFIFKQGSVIFLTAIFMAFYLQISIWKAFILAALFQGLLSAIDYGALLFNVSVFRSMPQIGEDYYTQSVLFIIIGKILLFMAVLVIQRHMGKDYYADLTDAEWLRFLFFPVFTIGIIAAMITTSKNAAGKEKGDVFSVIAFCLAGMNIVVFSLINDILKREKELRRNKVFQEQARNQTRLYRSISENFEKQKKKTHEFKNQMLCIEALAAQKKYDDLDKYIQIICGGLVSEFPAIQTNNVIVDAILNSKYQEMKEKKIVFVFKMSDLSEIHIQDEDVVVILSNLLNNAIEACEQCEDKKEIKVKFVREDNAVVLSVKNTCTHKIIYKDGEIQTTKEHEKEEHGVGIKNITDTITRYGGYYAIQNTEGEFYFSAVIPQ